MLRSKSVQKNTHHFLKAFEQKCAVCCLRISKTKINTEHFFYRDHLVTADNFELGNNENNIFACFCSVMTDASILRPQKTYIYIFRVLLAYNSGPRM